MRIIIFYITLFYAQTALTTKAYTQPVTQVDVCIYGGTSAGIIAAYTAKQLHKTVLLIEPGTHLGGLTTGGLGYTDIGNKYAITGLAKDFYRRVGRHYGRFEQWIFEPHVATAVFDQYLASVSLTVWKQHLLTAVQKQHNTITTITVTDAAHAATPRIVAAKMFIDCSYEGDLMARAGVSYTVGREANSTYHETYNGVQLQDKHQFADGIDPYIRPGQPQSGLLWGISKDTLPSSGSGDRKVQAYNFRICLTDAPDNRLPITRPDDYDSSRYELLLRLLQKSPAKDLRAFLKMDRMPNHKTDINNNGAFSTDMIGMNYAYAEADAATRQQIITTHENYTKGLLYFIGHDKRMPEHLRTAMLQWGYPKDEYLNNHHWSPQLYVREARRMVGAYVMTQANCEGREQVTDGIGMAAYTMDSHNCQRLVVNGMVKNEGNVEIGGFGPYPIAYRAIIPKAEECSNLLVPVCLSASHIAYGSIRMEPVFMALAQSAATAAVVAINDGTSVQQTDVQKIRQLLTTDPLADGSTPEILVDNDDTLHVRLQGQWRKEPDGAYGPSLYTPADSNDRSYVRFIPTVTKAGRYQIYTYLPRLRHEAATWEVIIYNGTQSIPVSIEPAAITVEGQTSGEWILLGTFTLQMGRQAYVQINSGGDKGAVAADAVLFVPVQ